MIIYVYKKNGGNRREYKKTIDPITQEETITEEGRYVSSESAEYSGTWMGECFVTITVKASAPIPFEIGDYITYRGEKFVINYDPTIIKKSSWGTYGEGFVYENIKFNSVQYELTDIRFLDYVLGDNKLHYSSLPVFNFYAADIEDFCDRLQANTDRWCKANNITNGDRWFFFSPNKNRTQYRGEASRGTLPIDWGTLYYKYLTSPDRSNAKTDLSISVSDKSIWDSLTMIKENFGYNFIIRGRVVIVGTGGISAEKLFRYGQGNGLYQFERNADTEQQIITELYAYGSTNNLPTRYYADGGYSCIATVGKLTVDDKSFWTIPLEYGSCFTVMSEEEDFDQCYKVTISSSGGEETAYIANPATQEEKVAEAFAKLKGVHSIIYFSNENTGAEGLQITFLSGIKRSAWPQEYRSGGSGAPLPNNMAVNRLMLPGFPTESLYKWVVSQPFQNMTSDEQTGRVSFTSDGVSYDAIFSKDIFRPYIRSVNSLTIGIREGIKYFDGSDGGEDIYPILKGEDKDFNPLNQIYDAEQVTDPGVFAEGEEEPTVKITLPVLDFDLQDLAAQGNNPSIYVESGYCGAREFPILTKSNGNYDITIDNGKPVVACRREYDDILQLWFPYYANDSGAYQLKKGDKFHFKGIPLPAVYITQASKRLFFASLNFLSKNDYTRYTFSPKIDEIYIARQREEVGEENSIYYTLKEGDLMWFKDDDIGISESRIFIDTLTIKENGNGPLPTIEVTLREDKMVGTIQRIQNEIDSLASGGGPAAAGGGGGGVSAGELKSSLYALGDARYLSKVKNDSAAGIITFLKGLVSRGTLTFESLLKSKGAIDDFINGIGIYMNSDEGRIQTDALEVRGWMRVMELIINRLQLMESDYSFTEGDTVEHVDIADDYQTMTFTMHKEFDTDRTPFYPGDILYSKTNDLQSHGTYFTSWFRVVSVDLTENKIVVAPYEGDAVPGGVNFTPLATAIDNDTDASDALYIDYYTPISEGSETLIGEVGYDVHMNLTRHGNVADSQDPSIKQSQLGRQQSWVLSTTDQRLSFFWNVNKPIIEEENYALCLGRLPDLSLLPDNRDKTMPSLYVNTVFANNFEKINYPAKIVTIDRGSWATIPSSVYTGNWEGEFKLDEQGTLASMLNDETYSDYHNHISAIIALAGKNYIPGQAINEPYHCKTFTMNDWLSYRLSDSWKSKTDKELYLLMKDSWHNEIDLEVSRVWSGGILWECIVDGASSQPVWGSSDWIVVSGSTVFALNFFTNDPEPLPLTVIQVYPSNVDFVVVPYLLLGDEDVSNMVTEWKWMRSSFDEGSDEQWNAGAGTSVRTHRFTNEDIPSGWGRGKKLEFTCTATFTKGGSADTIINRIKF